MGSHEEQWWSVRAGEYVLGTLRGEDLRLFEQILAHDTSMRAEVTAWERRLAPLHETATAATPGPHVWPTILDRIRQLPVHDNERITSNSTSAFEPGSNGADQSHPATLQSKTATLARHSRVWPAVAGLATAASLVLGVLLFQRTTEPAAFPLLVDGLSVVLSDEGGIPYFLVETDYENMRVRVTALSPPSLDETRDFQLWQASPDRSAVRPVALLPEEPGVAKVFDVSSLIHGSDLFGVSIEPLGAVTSAGPTGPVVAHGDFLPRREVE